MTGPAGQPAGSVAAPRLRVLYIAGAGRSGSTILDNVLGHVPGFASFGELRYLWERGLQHNRLCGCGLPLRSCPTWAAVLGQAFGGPDRVDAGAMVALQAARIRARHLPSLLRQRSRPPAAPDSYASAVLSLYRAIHDQSGARVVVDSSKLPTYGMTLAKLEGIDLLVVHLVRDPRATAYSWLRKKELPDFGDQRAMQRQRPLKSALLWSLWNAAAEIYWRGQEAEGRYIRVRYEDFVAAPLETVRDIVAHAGEHPAWMPFEPGEGQATAQLGVTHSVAGNPSRFRQGSIALRADEEWKERMRAADRLVVTLATWPLLLRYRYPVASRRGPGGLPLRKPDEAPLSPGSAAGTPRRAPSA